MLKDEKIILNYFITHIQFHIISVFFLCVGITKNVQQQNNSPQMCLCVRPQQLHIKNLLPYFMCDISEIEDVTNYLAPFIHKLSLHSIM